jgi:tRNA(fMet)-specific endonuclease VapC
VAIATISFAELLVGVELSDKAHLAERQALVDAVLATIPVLDYDASVAQSHATLLAAVRRQGRRRGAHDLIIAATAPATGRQVVSAGPSAFRGLPGVDLRSGPR